MESPGSSGVDRCLIELPLRQQTTEKPLAQLQLLSSLTDGEPLGSLILTVSMISGSPISYDLFLRFDPVFLAPHRGHDLTPGKHVLARHLADGPHLVLKPGSSCAGLTRQRLHCLLQRQQ